MSSSSSSWAPLASAASAAIGIGACLRASSALIGGTPGDLIGPSAAALSGALFVSTARRPPRRARCAAAALALALAVLPALYGAPPTLVLAASLVGGGAFGLALPAPPSVHPLALLLAAASAALGFAAPAAAAPALVALSLVDALPLDATRGVGAVSASPLRRAGAILTILIAAAIAAAAWSAGRPSLDPTPTGAAFALCAALAAAAIGAALPLGARWLSAWLSLAAGATLVALCALPEVSWRVLIPTAGSADPRPWLAALGASLVAPGGAALGAGIRALRGDRLQRPAIALAALGVLGGLNLGPDTPTALAWTALAAGLASLFSPGLLPRLAGLAGPAAAIALAIGALGWSEIDLLQGRSYHLREGQAPARASAELAGLLPVAGGWGPSGAALIQRDDAGAPVLQLDGLPLEPAGRAAATSVAAGHLAALALPAPRRALVLGDDLGLVVEALIAQELEQIDVAVPDVDLLRAWVADNASAASTHFHPSVRHVRGPLERTARGSDAVDLIVEIARTPWPDAHQGLPGAPQLDARAGALSPGGAYALVVPLIWMDLSTLRGLLGAFTERFVQSWAFLPPTGADQLILIGWTAPTKVSWDRAVVVAERGRPDLARLQINSALDLLDRAAVDGEGLAALADSGPRAGRPAHLTAALGRMPSMLAPTLRPHLSDASSLLEAPPHVLEALAARALTQDKLLELLEDASRGDMESIFSLSRELLEADRGDAALEPLLEPYLERAEALLEEGLASGDATHPSLGRCVETASGALALHPRSARTLSLIGTCQLERNQGNLAADKFEQALEFDPGDLRALRGAARIALQRRDRREAERLLTIAADRHPNDWSAVYQLGVLLYENRRDDDAEDLLIRAASLDPEQALPRIYLGHIYFDQRQLLRALTETELAADLAANDLEASRALLLRGQIYYELDQLLHARRDFEASILKGPTASAHLGVGAVFASEGELKRAEQALLRALDLAPGHPEALALLEQVRANLE